MQKLAVLLRLVSIFVIFILPSGWALADSVKYGSQQSSAGDLVAEVNALRIANNLTPYSVNSILTGTAQAQANYMASIGTVTHTGPSGISTTDRLLAAGYPLAGDLSQGGFRSENITGGTNKTAAQAVLEWQGDALHLNTMLSANLTEIGAGVSSVGNMVYMVIDCARPTTSGIPQAYTPTSGDSTGDVPLLGDFIVPITVSTPDANGMVYHEVQYGQTLWSIAIEYGVKIDDIRALNGLGTGTDIYQGEVLLIRKDAPVPSISPTASPTNQNPTPLAFGTEFANLTKTPQPNPTPIPDLRKEPTTTTLNEDKSITGLIIGSLLLVIMIAGLVSWMRSGRSG